jgi:hypothetical protein
MTPMLFLRLFLPLLARLREKTKMQQAGLCEVEERAAFVLSFMAYVFACGLMHAAAVYSGFAARINCFFLACPDA